MIFETGYGPSGLPHIGTFGEVARTSHGAPRLRGADRGPPQDAARSASPTTWTACARCRTTCPTRTCWPAYLDKPLTSVPDPFSNEYPSFAAHNNARLRRFLDRFGFEYEFLSATECYKAGLFDATLLRMLEVYDKVMDIILPTLGPERRATYSPFLPDLADQRPRAAGADGGAQRQAGHDRLRRSRVRARRSRRRSRAGASSASGRPTGRMRWTALGVDYEMCGKDLIDSVTLSSKICRALGGTPPESFIYELFLDEEGDKISKSKGNGLTIEEWLTYASPESLSLFMFQKPKAAKRLYFDVIPRTVDEYLQFLAAYPRQDAKAQARQRGLAHPRRHAAGGRAADHVRAAAQPGGGIQRARQGRAVGLHPPACAGREPADASAARSSGRLCGALLRGLREAAEEVPRCPTRSRPARCGRCRMRSARPARRQRPRSCRASSTTSGAPSRATRTRPPRAPRPTSRACRTRGSAPSTRCCSARRRGPASAASSSSTAWRTRGR